MKTVLRLCGHAITLTVHKRLDVLERDLRDISRRLDALAETQEALLRSSIFLVKDRQRDSQGTPAPGNAVERPDS